MVYKPSFTVRITVWYFRDRPLNENTKSKLEEGPRRIYNYRPETKYKPTFQPLSYRVPRLLVATSVYGHSWHWKSGTPLILSRQWRRTCLTRDNYNTIFVVIHTGKWIYVNIHRRNMWWTFEGILLWQRSVTAVPPLPTIRRPRDLRTILVHLTYTYIRNWI